MVATKSPIPKVPEPSNALLDVELREYGATSSAIAEATKRIETIRGLYLAGAFAVVGAILSSKPGQIPAIVSQVKADPYLLTPTLLLPFLNSLLLVYVASSMHFILAAAKYNTYYLGPSLERLSGAPVLQFDIWTSDDKEAWVLLRSMVGSLSYVLATSGSIAVLACFRGAGRFRQGTLPGLAFIVSVVVVAMSLVVGVTSLVISGRFHEHAKSKHLRPLYLYWATIPVAMVVYAALAWGL